MRLGVCVPQLHDRGPLGGGKAGVWGLQICSRSPDEGIVAGYCQKAFNQRNWNPDPPASYPARGAVPRYASGTRR